MSNEAGGIQAANVNPILVAIRSQLHPNQICDWDNHYLFAVDVFSFRLNRRSGNRIGGTDLLSAENQVDGIPGGLRIPIHQHIDPGGMPESKAALCSRFLDTVQIRTAHHQVNVSCECGMLRACFFYMDQHGQTTNHFMRDVFRAQRVGDLMQDSYQVK